ncbi:hypothetical protein BDZ97DRAFT_853390 [Flammula alnicola]|nr:hypothetical protein BDZ97DRAFT_853390 [Flammula alnicola]
MWKCGEPYKYPIPKEDGNPWEKLLQSLLKRDRDQCDSWKDEVENLLIFAGLFSAVVTAFVTQSYKGLRPDPNDSVIFLLSQIVAHLDNGLNNTSARALATSPLQIPLSPTPPSTFRVNALWFISLVLSLTTVLVGIVSLQWLREHLRYPVQIDPKEQFALFHMRSEGLEKWYIPEIFSLLPLLLQAALALFLVGLVDFLLALGHRVAIPVIVVIAVPIIFLIATTSLPTLQAFSLSLPLRDSVPAQCPYKSPQSRLFRRLASLTGTTFRACAALFIGFHFLIVRLPLIIFQNIKNSKSGPRFRQYLYHSRHFDYKIWHLNTWLLFDKAWLDIRDRYSVRLYRQPNKPTEDTPVPFDVFSFGPLYDLTHGLRKVRHETRLANAQFTLYRCVEELTSSIVDQNTILTVPNSPENVAWIFHQNQYLQALLGYEVSLFDRVRAFSHLLAQPNIKILHDENLLLFFSTYGYSWQSAEIKRHVAELYTRLMVYCYASGPHKLDPAIFDVSRKEFYAVGLLSLRRKLHCSILILCISTRRRQISKLFRNRIPLSSSQYSILLPTSAWKTMISWRVFMLIGTFKSSWRLRWKTNPKMPPSKPLSL